MLPKLKVTMRKKSSMSENTQSRIKSGSENNDYNSKKNTYSRTSEMDKSGVESSNGATSSSMSSPEKTDSNSSQLSKSKTKNNKSLNKEKLSSGTIFSKEKKGQAELLHSKVPIRLESKATRSSKANINNPTKESFNKTHRGLTHKNHDITSRKNYMAASNKRKENLKEERFRNLKRSSLPHIYVPENSSTPFCRINCAKEEKHRRSRTQEVNQPKAVILGTTMRKGKSLTDLNLNTSDFVERNCCNIEDDTKALNDMHLKEQEIMLEISTAGDVKYDPLNNNCIEKVGSCDGDLGITFYNNSASTIPKPIPSGIYKHRIEKDKHRDKCNYSPSEKNDSLKHLLDTVIEETATETESNNSSASDDNATEDEDDDFVSVIEDPELDNYPPIITKASETYQKNISEGTQLNDDNSTIVKEEMLSNIKSTLLKSVNNALNESPTKSAHASLDADCTLASGSQTEGEVCLQAKEQTKSLNRKESIENEVKEGISMLKSTFVKVLKENVKNHLDESQDKLNYNQSVPNAIIHPLNKVNIQYYDALHPSEKPAPVPETKDSSPFNTLVVNKRTNEIGYSPYPKPDYRKISKIPRYKYFKSRQLNNSPSLIGKLSPMCMNTVVKSSGAASPKPIYIYNESVNSVCRNCKLENGEHYLVTGEYSVYKNGTAMDCKKDIYHEDGNNRSDNEQYTSGDASDISANDNSEFPTLKRLSYDAPEESSKPYKSKIKENIPAICDCSLEYKNTNIDISGASNIHEITICESKTQKGILGQPSAENMKILRLRKIQLIKKPTNDSVKEKRPTYKSIFYIMLYVNIFIFLALLLVSTFYMGTLMD